MVTSAWALTLLLAASPDCLFGDPHPQVPKEVPTFRITLSTGETVHGGLLDRQQQWVTQTTDPVKPHEPVDIVMDTPWAPQELLRSRGSQITLTYETPALRRSRLEQGWKEAKFERIDMPGGCLYVSKREVDLALKAMEMEAALSEAQTADGAFAARPAAAGRAGLLAWKWHILLGLAGLAIAGALIKTMVLTE